MPDMPAEPDKAAMSSKPAMPNKPAMPKLCGRNHRSRKIQT